MIHLLVLLSVLCTTLHADDLACSGVLTIAARTEWVADEYTCREVLEDSVSNVVIHHIPGTSCEGLPACKLVLQNIQAYHKEDRQMKDIAYNFLIDKAGNVYEGRGWRTVGYHHKSLNKVSIGIAYLGTFTDATEDGTVLGKVQELITCGVTKNFIKSGRTVKAYLDKGQTIIPADEALITAIETW